VGQKVNPIGFRLAINKDWQSRWFAGKAEYGPMLQEDLRIREYVKAQLISAAVAKVMIERFANRIRVSIHSGRPGLVIGRKGAELDRVKAGISKLVGNKEIYLDIKEIKQPELNAQLVAENVAQQLERRISHRRAMKRTIQTTMELGADGVRIRCAGRLGGAELARVEQYKEGKVPLHTLRENVTYGFAEANTLAGKVGIKVWICTAPELEESQNAINAKTSQAPKGAARKHRRQRNVQQ